MENIVSVLDVFVAVNELQSVMPKGWKITLTVPSDEVEGVWPVLHHLLEDKFTKAGVLKNRGVIEFVPSADFVK